MKKKPSQSTCLRSHDGLNIRSTGFGRKSATLRRRFISISVSVHWVFLLAQLKDEKDTLSYISISLFMKNIDDIYVLAGE